MTGPSVHRQGIPSPWRWILLYPGWRRRGRRKEDLKVLREKCAMVEQDILAERNHSETDVAFHVAIAKCTQNMVVPKLIPIITHAVKRFVSLTESRLKTETIVVHREILDTMCFGRRSGCDGDDEAYQV